MKVAIIIQNRKKTIYKYQKKIILKRKSQKLIVLIRQVH